MLLADLPRVAELVTGLMAPGMPAPIWSLKALRRHFLDPAVTGWVTGARGRARAALIARAGAPVLHVDVLVVEPGSRRHGEATALMALAHAYAAGEGWRCELLVREANAVAVGFYRRRGYQLAERLPGYYCGRETALRMTHNPCPTQAQGEVE